MPLTNLGRAHSKQVDYICVAGDLLDQMMSELQIAVNYNSKLALAMATAGRDLRKKLQSLLGTIELITAARPPADIAVLASSAKAKVFRLADELEELARYVEQDPTTHSPLKQSFCIASLLDQIHMDWSSEAREKRLGFKINHASEHVENDPYLLAVIVTNLVANAIRYTRSGEVRVDCTVQGGQLILAVNDTGPGIPGDILIGKPGDMQTVRALGDGLGLGLSIVRRTVDLLKHTIAFKTDSSGGTTVCLHVPLSTGDARHQATREGS
jgi:signal transduction histidine kinase